MKRVSVRVLLEGVLMTIHLCSQAGKSSPARKLFLKLGLAVFTAGCIGFFAAQAQAAAVEGCDPRVLNAQQKVAMARVAESKAIDDEIFVQDDSVLVLTCFNKSASAAAHGAANVFSGDFRQELDTVVRDGLTGIYSNFKDFTTGGGSGALAYETDPNAVDADGNPIDNDVSIDMTPLNEPLDYECENIRNLWAQVNTQGVSVGTPYTTLDDIVDDTLPPGAGDKYELTRGSPVSVAIRADARVALDFNGDGDLTNDQPAIPSYSNLNTPCDVFQVAGPITVTTCP